MINTSEMIEKVQNGFKTLSLPDIYKQSALDWIHAWLIDDHFKEYVPQIAHLIALEKWDFLLDSFYQEIPFGTGGRRGLVGIGPNRINIWTIRSSAQGHSQYLIQHYGERAKSRGIVLTYDVRKYTQKGVYNDDEPNPVMGLDCKQLAKAAAEVYAGNGIRVYMYDGVRSTPGLSFTIRHLGTVSGVMFSASHNLPTDNGKKVYDEFGGQLIPPFDQELVTEVTQNVQKINPLSIQKAKKQNLVKYVGEEVDTAYLKAVTSLSLSTERKLKILYSPLHGTGITSVYPALQNLGFDVTLDPKTSNLSGAFENVTFNIPNPEVIESFDASIPEAEKINADIILNTDPDADRIGIMVMHNNKWTFLNGNEIGIILSNYAISKFKEKGRISKDSMIIKTDVTTSMIEKLAKKNNIQCISNLLVGFKYIGNEMNKLEENNKHHHFILGTEESHGYIMGNYCRDKDAAVAAIWLSELAAELKREERTLVDYLNRIYSEYGYCHNYLTEIRLLGAKGIEQISAIMKHFRGEYIQSMGSFNVQEKVDRWSGDPQPHLSQTDTSSRNVIKFMIHSIDNTQSIRIIVRPSGTEPKFKIYFEIFGNPFDLNQLEEEKEKVVRIREQLERDFMNHCYQILGIDFPKRGYLLFWQLPLNDKLKYFEVESQIADLIHITDKAVKKEKLNDLLKFLGADPIKKIDKAFTHKYGSGVYEYLGLN